MATDDVLGTPYECRIIDLGSDREGPITATLVHRAADPGRRTPTAVLYLHGFVDYFFQTHLADFHVGQGHDFYALDLRKYGRSLAGHQTPNLCAALTDYYPEIDEAVRLIREVDGHDRLLLNAHSTGGLVAALWAHDRRGRGQVQALFLNSPFLDLNVPWLLRRPMAAVAAGLGGLAPMTRIPFALNRVYGSSIHHGHRGTWSYDLAWKPIAGFPVRAGWLRAVRAGQFRVHRGLALDVPVLVAASTKSYKRFVWNDAALAADSVLDVEHMARWAPALGPDVRLVRIDGGLHDLTLSAEPARSRLFEALEGWMADAFPSDHRPRADAG